MIITKTINYLEYRCYAYNRSKNPQFEPKLYETLFKDWENFEERYQEEKIYWDEKVKLESES